MNNWLEYIRNNHISIYRISLFLIAIALALYIMPRKKSFIFDTVEGKPWPHENLISDMEFSILKSAEEIKIEKIQVSDQNKFCFYLDPEKKLEGRTGLSGWIKSQISNKGKTALGTGKVTSKTFDQPIGEDFDVADESAEVGFDIDKPKQEAPKKKGVLLREALGIEEGTGLYKKILDSVTEDFQNNFL